MRAGQLVVGLVLVAACTRTDSGRPTALATGAPVADTAHPWRKPGDKIDSILPMQEYLRRFRAGLTQPHRLAGGAANPEALARRFLAAVSARDTAAFTDLIASRAEFAWLVFPEHSYARPPYELDPEIFWLQLTAGSAKGLGRTLQRYGGLPLTLLALQCRPDTLQIKTGSVRLQGNCELRFQAGDSVETRRLFGSVVERNGVAKLLSYANDF